MPVKIQTGETALALARAYGIKGSLPLELDETVVPVHILGSLDPTIPQIGPSPLGATRGWAGIVPAGGGAGNHRVVIVDIKSTSAIKRNVLIESIRPMSPVGEFSWGIGLVQSPRGGAGTIQRIFKLDRTQPGDSVFLGGAVAGALDLRMFPINYLAADIVGPAHINQLFFTGSPDEGEYPVGIVLGQTASRDAGGLDWESAAAGVAMTPGNSEFWVRCHTVNSTCRFNIRLSVLGYP